jgi:hypothetical protein
MSSKGGLLTVQEHASSTRRPKTTISSFFKILLFVSGWALLSVFIPSKSVISIRINFGRGADSVDQREHVSVLTASTEPGDEWRDDVWPFRPQSPWDISTDFPHPRKLEYDVTEGTWMRLDIHPETGDIVFDMLGDIYCLPASSYSDAKLLRSTGAPTYAYPVLVGVPHDTDPHFSPDGKLLSFTSDAGLGVQNVWVTKWNGHCKDMHAKAYLDDPDSAHMLGEIQNDERLLNMGVSETEERRHRRLIREGRAQGVLNPYLPYQ